MGEFEDTTFLGLALGGKHERFAIHVLSHWLADMEAQELLDRCLKHFGDNNRSQTVGERVALTYAARIADGEAVHKRMREMVAEWCRRRLKGGARGRPSSKLKQMAVQWAFIERVLKAPAEKREAIVAELQEKYRLSRRQVRNLIDGFEPTSLRNNPGSDQALDECN